MELALKKEFNNGFTEMKQEEMLEVQGGSDGMLGFLGDIYDGWCDMWHDFGANLYHLIND